MMMMIMMILMDFIFQWYYVFVMKCLYNLNQYTIPFHDSAMGLSGSVRFLVDLPAGERGLTAGEGVYTEL